MHKVISISLKILPLWALKQKILPICHRALTLKLGGTEFKVGITSFWLTLCLIFGLARAESGSSRDFSRQGFPSQTKNFQELPERTKARLQTLGIHDEATFGAWQGAQRSDQNQRDLPRFLSLSPRIQA